ncbi:hypothetical protein A1O3_02046 [Capronia epimyces CBS 606.96]|uniref:Histone deacetylation protein Rxt3 n=1 Tax=Capronia epimyces CBS 606.96 TaxID=1182542 RepID=W9Y814_9EURO|nr:uncharacterized protein A1O3_02046 [Capronia epimyces CBS 606.96]EXJ88982.1 hypothetical protein A1O3_02046 [Capronia epimyces CBS 606.96]
MSLGALMSPPQYPSNPTLGEYSYKTRSKTPDRSAGSISGPRPHRSSSGTMTHRPGSFYEPPPRSGSGAYPEPRYTPPFGPTAMPKDDFEDRARRTSISGILQNLQQRPESQPQPTTVTATFPPASNPPIRPESIPPSLGHAERPAQPPLNGPDHSRPNGLVGSYDTRPPGQPTLSRFSHTAPVQQPGPSLLDRSLPQSQSPDMRRSQPHANENRGLAGILNQPPDSAFSAQNMMRQDSVQSQSDRSVLGDRLRNRPYSPFAGSVASQTMDDQFRKGSDELSQHRAILGLANDSKRGRYSPLPQAVQGAQAQTPQPDAGIKTEHGRVFSGIGSGLGSLSAAQTPAPQPLSASPFKRDEGGSRLSEENLMKMSRSASGMGKRNRKAPDEDTRAESDVGDAKKAGPGRGKRSKYQHSYKLDLEDAVQGARKNGPYATSSQIRRVPTPTSNPSQLQHHHHYLQRQTSAVDNNPSFRPRKTIRISSVVALARRNPRRHLGFFRYDPEVGPIDLHKAVDPKFDIAVRPNLLPSFTEAEHTNCTYTVRVPRTWLRQRERGLICQERYLWGSGIYSDDSDPVAAAMHSGFIASVHPPGIDEALLQKVIEEQNPRIEGSTAPERPMPVDETKDLHITLLVLPQLEQYVESVRFGIKSRSWPDEPESSPSATTDSGPTSNKTPHDGVSFMVLKTEFVEDGAEVKRVGRTGKEKRARLQRELRERKRGFELEKKKLELAAERARLRKESLKRERKVGSKGVGVVTSDTVGGSSDRRHRANGEQHQENGDSNKKDMMKLDVGQSPGDWIRQLAVAAA